MRSIQRLRSRQAVAKAIKARKDADARMDREALAIAALIESMNPAPSPMDAVLAVLTGIGFALILAAVLGCL